MTLSIARQTTATLAHTATAAQIRAALEALPAIGAGNVAVAKLTAPTPIFQVTFQGALAATEMTQLIADSSLAPTTLRITVDKTQPGGSGLNDVQTLTFSQPPSGGTWSLTLLVVTGGREQEVDVALDWIAATMRADATLVALFGPHIYRTQGPLFLPNTQPPLYAQIQHQTNTSLIVVGGHRIAVPVTVAIKAVHRTAEPSIELSAFMEQIEQLLGNRRWITVPGGYIASCVQRGVMIQEERPTPGTVYHTRGGIFDLIVQRTIIDES